MKSESQSLQSLEVNNLEPQYYQNPNSNAVTTVAYKFPPRYPSYLGNPKQKQHPRSIKHIDFIRKLTSSSCKICRYKIYGEFLFFFHAIGFPKEVFSLIHAGSSCAEPTTA